MTRKSPVLHHVRPHERAGITVHRYERGSGTKPQMRTTVKPRPGFKGYMVTLIFDEGRESHNTPAGTLTEAVTQGIGLIQTPKIPRRVQVRRLK